MLVDKQLDQHHEEEQKGCDLGHHKERLDLPELKLLIPPIDDHFQKRAWKF
jgi:hypothetical protein